MCLFGQHLLLGLIHQFLCARLLGMGRHAVFAFASGSLGHNGLASHQVLLDHGNMYVGPQKDRLVRKHEFEFFVTDGGCSAHNDGLDQIAVLSGCIDSLHHHVSNVPQDLLGLSWQDSHENKVARSSHLLVVENTVHSKLGLELPQQVRLPGRDDNLQVVDLLFHF